MKETTQKLLEFLSLFARVLRLVFTADKRLTVLTVLFGLVGTLLVPAQLWITKVLIDDIVFLAGGPIGFDAYLPFITPLAVLGAVWIASGALETVTHVHQKVLISKVNHSAQSLMLSKAMTLDLAFFESPELQGELEHARRGSQRNENIAYLTIDSIRRAVALISLVALTLPLQPIVFPVLLVVSAPKFFFDSKFIRKLHDWYLQFNTRLRRAEYFSEILSSKEAAKEVRIYGTGMYFINRFDAIFERNIAEQRDLEFAEAKVTVWLSLLRTCGVLAIYLFSVYQAVVGILTVGEMVLIFDVTLRLRGEIFSLFFSGSRFYEHILYIKWFFRFLDLEPSEIPGALSVAVERRRVGATVGSQKGLELRRVSFVYPGTTRVVLSDFSCRILRGESVAIVGENGAGKSTLLKLLSRLYDPTDGEILLDGVDLRDYELQELRRRLSCVFQDFMKYNLSVRENIGLGDVSRMERSEDLRCAARSVGAGHLLDRLERGLDTELGKIYGAGVDLSGGEWQRLALSRGWFRGGDIMLFDEPTSSLDSVAEREFASLLREESHERLTIVVTHRVATAQAAKRILLMHDGRLTEEGSHDELLSLGGRYVKLFNAQGVGEL